MRRLALGLGVLLLLGAAVMATATVPEQGVAALYFVPAQGATR
jgi:hypothetical protein